MYVTLNVLVFKSGRICITVSFNTWVKEASVIICPINFRTFISVGELHDSHSKILLIIIITLCMHITYILYSPSILVTMKFVCTKSVLSVVTLLNNYKIQNYILYSVLRLQWNIYVICTLMRDHELMRSNQVHFW